DVEELRAAFNAVRSQSKIPVFAQMTVGTDGKTHYGTDPVDFGPILQAMGADVIGVNCSVGPHGVLEAVEKLARVVTVPISRARGVTGRATWRPRNTWRSTRAGSPRRAHDSSEAAAERHPTTSRRLSAS